jgi:lysophospholipase L1-like esterase
VLKLLLWGAVALVLWAGGRTAWRVQHSIGLARQSESLQHAPERATVRLLIVGDSTAVGTGASGPQASVAGLLAQAFPHLQIDNRARDGATFAQVLGQLGGDQRFDMVLVMAGGNDVVRLRDLDALREDVHRVVRLALERAGDRPGLRTGFYPDGWHILNRDLQAEVMYRDVEAWLRDAAAPLPSGVGPVRAALGG